MEPINVHGKVRKAALHLTQLNLKLSKPPSYLKKLSQVFQFADPDKQVKADSLQRHRVLAQQRAVHLNEFIEQSVSDAWIITFDGGYRNDEKIGANGWSIWSVKDDIWELVRAEGNCNSDKTTVNVEEFSGLVRALSWMAKHLPSREVHVFGDSKLVIGTMQNKLHCRAESMKVLAQQIRNIIQRIPNSNIRFWHIRREFNRVADYIANLSMDRKQSVVVDSNTPDLVKKLVELNEDSLKERIYTAPINAVTRAQAKKQSEQQQGPITNQELSRIRVGQLATPWMKHQIEWLETGKLPKEDKACKILKIWSGWFEMHQGVLWYAPPKSNQWRLVIPLALRKDVLREFHDNAGHFKGQRFLMKMHERFYWPGLSSDVRHFQDSCVLCQTGKAAKWRQEVPLSTLKELTWRPFQCIAVDSIVNLPETANGNKHLIVLVDYFSRWPVVVPVKDLSMFTWVKAFTEHFVTIYGCPERLVSDRGGQFIGDLAMALYKHLRIHKQSTTAYHPMANGLVERFNATLTTGLRLLVSEHQQDWDEQLAWFLFAYRTSVHASTQCTPYELIFGQAARVPYDVLLRQFDEPALKLEPRLLLRQKLQDVGEQRARARQLSELERNRYARLYNNARQQHRYAVGDRVWLYHPVVPRGVKPKLHNLWRGPFVIAEVLSDVNYRLEVPSGRRLHGVVHANRLKRFVDRARWPEKPPRDNQLGPVPRLPAGYEDLDFANDIPSAKMVRITDERIRTTSSGTRHREFLVTLKNSMGTRQVWLDEHFIIAGDLIYEFRHRRKRQQLGNLVAEGEGDQVFLAGMCGNASTSLPGGMSPI